jgi:xanthine dehydrogenase YagS FAD-binding subunit
MLSKFSYTRTTTLKQAVEASSRPGARILAGGTDLLGCLRDQVFTAGTLVSLNGIKELKGIRRGPDGGWRIGALTTLAEIADHKELAVSYRALVQAAASAASPQLRNQGTIGGNLCQRPRCWYYRKDFRCLRKGGDACFAAAGENQHHAIFGGAPCFMVHPSDTAPALVALEARVTIAGRRPRTIPLAKFFLLPGDNVLNENVLAQGELITEILLPPPQAGARSTYRKVRERGAFDFALAGAAVVVSLDGGNVGRARVVLSGVAPVPWRAVEAEKVLEGKSLTADTVAQAAAAAVKDASPLPRNEYKVPLVRGILQESLLALAG